MTEPVPDSSRTIIIGALGLLVILLVAASILEALTVGQPIRIPIAPASTDHQQRSLVGLISGTNTGGTYTISRTNSSNRISVSSVGLCSSNCIYPAPHASTWIIIDATVPVSTIVVYVNGTYDGFALQNPSMTTIACTTAAGQACSVQLGGSGFSSGTYTSITRYYATCSVPAGSTTCLAVNTPSVDTLTKFAYQYKGSVPSNFIPAVRGDTCVFTFIATFQDGSMVSDSSSTIAD